MKVSPRPEPLVKHWFDVLPLKVQAPVHALCALVQSCDDELLRGVHWGNLVFSYRGRALLAISTHRTHINLQVFNGSLLLSRFPMLLGSDKQAKHLKCPLGDPLDEALVCDLVRASIRLAGTRVPHFQEGATPIQAPDAGWSAPAGSRPPVVISRVSRRRIVLPQAAPETGTEARAEVPMPVSAAGEDEGVERG
ncbi:DUF1801 domain-containing protein [Amphibiibacter pelophylacis]|uniref:DUF1801 domain-containing protein n=1 Tax=Amphibiibacter pelophylacis TaxID=1799477 RepID=A0ACC6P4U0_9BURK